MKNIINGLSVAKLQGFSGSKFLRNTSTMLNKNYDDFLQASVESLQKYSQKDSMQFLIDKSKIDDGFEMLNGSLYKHGEHTVQLLGKKVGLQYSQNLETLNKIGLGVVPKQLDTVPKDDILYVVSHVPGTKSGTLTPMWEKGVKDKVTKEAKLAAYHDLQKLTKAGFIDDAVARSNELWFVAPDDNSIVLPVWNSLRKIRPDESRQKIIENYYNILFKQ